MNRKKIASTIVAAGVIATTATGCGEKERPLNERVFIDVICIKVYTAGGSGSNCSAILQASTDELENCIPHNPSSPISSMTELTRYCPSVTVRIANNSYSGASTTPTPSQGTDTGNDSEAAPETENMSGVGDTVKAVGLGIIGLVAVTILGFLMRARRDRQNRTAQRAHAAEHGWHN